MTCDGHADSVAILGDDSGEVVLLLVDEHGEPIAHCHLTVEGVRDMARTLNRETARVAARTASETRYRPGQARRRRHRGR